MVRTPKRFFAGDIPASKVCIPHRSCFTLSSVGRPTMGAAAGPGRERCFSIVGSERSIDLQAENDRDCKVWFLGMQVCCPAPLGGALFSC